MGAGWRRWLWLVIAAGVAVRLVIAFTTYGETFDTHAFGFLYDLLRRSPLDIYVPQGGRLPWVYPPLYVPWIYAAGRLAAATSLPLHALITLPGIAADAALAWLVQAFLGERGASPRARLAAASLVALGPSFIVISGYHNQFDSVAFLPAAGALYAWDRLRDADERQRALTAGLLIGVGCALKTVPILMLLALLPTARSRREGLTLVAAALALPLLLVLPFFLHAPGDAIRTLRYTGLPGAGGLSLAIQPHLASAFLLGETGITFNRLSQTLIADHGWVLGLSLVGIGVFAFRRRTPAACAAVLLWLTVYVFGTAFFFQYLIWGLPFLIMAGYLRAAAAVQLLALWPAIAFYVADRNPWSSEIVPVTYVAAMLVLWLGFIGGLALLGRREAVAARAEGRLRDRVLPVALAAPRRVDAMIDRRTRTWLMALAAGLAAFALAPLVAMLYTAAHDHLVFSGATGQYAADQLQYMSWIRSAGAHVLAANLFTLTPSAAVFLHPMFALSGLVWRIFGSIQGAFLVWLPVAIAVLYFGVRRYVLRFVGGAGARLAAAALALFFASPIGYLAYAADPSGTHAKQLLDASGELFAAVRLWGYLPTAIAIGLAALTLLEVERGLDPDARAPGRSGRRYLGWGAAAALGAAWLHPWQGEVLIVILVGLAVWGGGFRRRDLLLPIVAAALPLAYYFLLGHLNADWKVAQAANTMLPLPATEVFLAAAPLALPALLAYRWPAPGAGERMLRLWPVAVVAVQFALSPTIPAHALEGASIPLAVLAVRGWQSLDLRRPLLGAAAVVLLIVPGAIEYARIDRDFIRGGHQPTYLTDGEHSALRFLDDAAPPGGVLTTPYLGAAVPAFSGDPVWAGHPSWSPNWGARKAAAHALFAGRLLRGQARSVVRLSGARYLLADCAHSTPALGRLLGKEVSPPKRFGCAELYRVRGP